MNTLARVLSKAHSHAEIEHEKNAEQVVFTEEAVLNILKFYGITEEPDWEYSEDDVEKIKELPDFIIDD